MLGKSKQSDVKKGKTEVVKENRDKVKNMIEADDDELETHFVENPFIKLREKTLLKNAD
jgi:hypothetical protein